MTITLLLLLLGLGSLVFGGDLLVRGAVTLAQRAGLSPLIIGLTLVGFGTSTPELVTSVQASLSGAPGIAYGNIVGSNIANILLILGVSALITELTVQRSAIRRDGVFMLMVACAFAIIAFALDFGRLVGAAFLFVLVAYLVFVVRAERQASRAAKGAFLDKAQALEALDPATDPATPANGPVWLALVTLTAGLALIMAGGYVLVDAAVDLAQSFGVSETVIGLTIVAVGTSAPELVTSVIAALRKQGDVAFGNVVGSNIYNILAIGGATALIAPARVPQSIVTYDNLVMIAASVAILVFAFTRARISRLEGGLLLAAYIAYMISLWPGL